MDKFLTRLKDLRGNMGLSINDLSEYLNVTPEYLENVEKGDEIIDTTLLGDICALYGCDYEYLLGYNDNFSHANIAFRSEDTEKLDLNAIAAVNRVRADLKFLDNL